MTRKRFWTKPSGAFLIGGLVGLIIFALLYDIRIVNPTNVNWIWRSVTHDTAQHQLGWEFYRQTGSHGIIKGLLYPGGISMVFMDVIPLLALIFKPFAGVLPTNFQYFGLWGLACYVLMGALAAVIMQKVWRKVNRGAHDDSLWQVPFLAASALIFCMSPVVMARQFYHPALAGQWIILLGFLLIIDTLHFRRSRSLVIAWSLVLGLTILIHPYFLPMMGVLMMVSYARFWKCILPRRKPLRRLIRMLVMAIIPAAVSMIIFYLIGGFSQGSGAEVHDLSEKGFNFLSFVNSYGYSAFVPAIPTKSHSPESMMWLGLGVLLTILLAACLTFGHYKHGWRRIKNFIQSYKMESIIAGIFCLLLLIFSIGTRADAGPITLWEFQISGVIDNLWTAFRAAAREAWPFYYGVILTAIVWLSFIMKRHVSASKLPVVLAVCLCALAIVQTVDIRYSAAGINKRIGFKNSSQTDAEFKALNLTDIYGSQKNLVPIDANFRYDQSGTYVIGRTALKYGMTMGIGFYARVPDSQKAIQTKWRNKVKDGKLSKTDLKDNLFMTIDPTTADKAANKYQVLSDGRYYFIGKK